MTKSKKNNAERISVWPVLNSKSYFNRWAVLYLFLSLMLFVSCKNTVESKIVDRLKKECGNDTPSKCSLSMKDATNFDWDKLYIIPDWTTSDSIARAIRLEYSGGDVPDDITRIIFIAGRKVVHEEDIMSLDYRNSTIDFNSRVIGIANGKVRCFTTKKAVFLVRKIKIDGSCSDCYSFILSNKD